MRERKEPGRASPRGWGAAPPVPVCTALLPASSRVSVPVAVLLPPALLPSLLLLLLPLRSKAGEAARACCTSSMPTMRSWRRAPISCREKEVGREEAQDRCALGGIAAACRQNGVMLQHLLLHTCSVKQKAGCMATANQAHKLSHASSSPSRLTRLKLGVGRALASHFTARSHSGKRKKRANSGLPRPWQGGAGG